MPETNPLPVEDLIIDLHNFRTVAKKTEVDAILAMISLSSGPFWALMHSLLDDGYLPTENILVLKTKDKGKERLLVKEGNRRVAALKLAFRYVSSPRIDIPEDLETKIKALTPAWKKANKSVSCAIYEEAEAKIVDKIVTMTHGKKQQAGRDTWKAVGRARHNREQNGASEPGLDILEKFLKKTTELSQSQADSWGGDYNVTVLDEALKLLAPRCGYVSAKELASGYPGVGTFRQPLDKIIKHIGHGLLGFPHLRNSEEDFAVSYGFAPKPSPGGPEAGTGGGTGTGSAAGSGGSGGTGGGSGGGATSNGSNKKRRRGSSQLSDSRTVRKKLWSLSFGKNREKVVTLLDEITKLKLSDNPLAFCFLLRSMFEISGKVYCDENNLPTTRGGSDLPLKTLLTNVTTHLTTGSATGSPDILKMRELHGALAELNNSSGFLSVTSMNQLVHHTSFSTTDAHICSVFSNVFPLLEEMCK